MTDCSDLGRKRNGLFDAMCFRRRGLPLLSWATTPEELNPSPSLLAEMFIRRLLEHLSDRVCPLLLAGLRVLWLFRRRVCLWGKLGLLRLGIEYYLATPEPPPGWLGLPAIESGYAWGYGGH